MSGKGGTGKTTVSLLLANSLASQGKRVLLVELNSRSSAYSLTQSQVKPKYKPTPSPWGFDWCLLQGLDCLIEYVGSFTGVESLTQKVFESSIIKTLVNVAPGLNDLSVLGKLTSHFRGHGPGFDYDHIIVDAHSTGSFQSLLIAPELLGKSVSSGPLKNQSQAIQEVLKDSKKVQFFFIGLAEELPVDELEDTLSEFENYEENQVLVIVNKTLEVKETNIKDECWQAFLNERLNEQSKQLNRVKDLWKNCFEINLVTESLREKLNHPDGEVLRPL